MQTNTEHTPEYLRGNEERENERSNMSFLALQIDSCV